MSHGRDAKRCPASHPFLWTFVAVDPAQPPRKPDENGWVSTRALAQARSAGCIDQPERSSTSSYCCPK